MERIEYEEMTKDWVKATVFTEEELWNLRVLRTMLFFSNAPEEVIDKIINQYTKNKVPVAYSYEELLNEGKTYITKEGYDRALRKYKPLFELWNQNLPSIFKNYLDVI